MKKGLKPALWIALGIALGFPIFSMTYYTMVRTSTPEFCASCHEIQAAYDGWRTSTHVNNPQGFVADCMDCHLPAPQDTVDFFYTKTLHGMKDVAAHLAGKPYIREEQAEKARLSIKNDQCLKCHRNIEYMPYKRGAMLAHRQVLHPRKGYEKRCVECHSNLVHVDREYYDYKDNGGI
ncbi:cytochrome c3 family protein [Maridesulfovibrio bastinii]|uniref:cytochrome c3 family protein n=1 Tax=Maridesulfovibrio bastinii TaxID=47157 RepID=UPI0003F89547|nr:NapC/NirT family cytochrome c [Maridesulfovibrio bastinii]